jgi:hypothetical protein
VFYIKLGIIEATEQNASKGCRKRDIGRSPTVSTSREEETNVEYENYGNEARTCRKS